jgi:hypothetical protein
MKAGFLRRTRDEQIGEALSDDQLEKKLRYLDADFEHRYRKPLFVCRVAHIWQPHWAMWASCEKSGINGCKGNLPRRVLK